MTERGAQVLDAYHDGELSWWARRRFEGRLRRSPELRRELDLLEEMRAAARQLEPALDASGSASGSPDVWGAIAGRLRGIDAARDAERTASRATWAWIPGWRPMGAAAVGAAALALVLVLQQGPPPAPVISAADGALRMLDSGGRPVMVVHDAADTTIIWLMDAPADEA